MPSVEIARRVDCAPLAFRNLLPETLKVILGVGACDALPLEYLVAEPN